MTFNYLMYLNVTLVIALILILFYESNSFKKRYHNMRDHYVTIIMALASAIDARDPSTLGHTERVMDLSKGLALEMSRHGYKIDLEALKLAALLHDIGKIGVPEAILRKPGAPTPDEWKEIKKHPSIGANILEPLHDLKDIKDAVKYHQEHYNGLGYPRGLKAKDIPLMSRIIMVVDAYDAMTSDRVYRPRRSRDEAINELRANAGTQFDPEIVEVFSKVAKSIEKDK
jgi:putative nucleotidyltransferase with HDIG domain